MGWIYLADLEALPKPWAPGSTSGPTVKMTASPKLCSCLEWEEVKSAPPASGTTSAPCAADGRCHFQWTSSPAAGPARETLMLDFEKAWKTSAAHWLSRSAGLWAYFDPVTSFWKTFQVSLPLLGMGSVTSCENWPRSGMTAAGRCYQLPKLAPPTSANDSGCWPTATVMDTHAYGKPDVGRTSENSGKTLLGKAAAWPTPMAEDSERWKTSPSRKARGYVNLVEKSRDWPTPTVNGNNNQLGLSEKSGDGLATAAKTWATPAAADSQSNGPGGQEKSLRRDILNWATPQAHDNRGGDAKRVGRHGTKAGDRNLVDDVAAWPTPAARDWRSGEASEDTMAKNARPLNEVACHFDPQPPTTLPPGPKSSEPSPKLNPRFVEWLLGYRIGTTELEPWATQWMLSVRGKRLKS